MRRFSKSSGGGWFGSWGWWWVSSSEGSGSGWFGFLKVVVVGGLVFCGWL